MQLVPVGKFLRFLPCTMDVTQKLLIILFFDSMERIVNQSIREQQDEAYMESLRADQEKQRQRELEREEQRKIELEKQRLLQEELMRKMVGGILI